MAGLKCPDSILMNVMGAELSLLDCRMIEEGIKHRRWTEAFAST
jgi:hypothetical protein